MKRFIAVLLGIIMMFSMSTFVACDDTKPSGGNNQEQVEPEKPEKPEKPEEPKDPVFEKADEAKLNAVKAYLSANKGKLVGDREAADWMRGFEITLGADVNLDVDVKLEGDILISLGKLINGMLGGSPDGELTSVGNISLRVDADAAAKEIIEWTAEQQETLLKDIVKAVGDVNAKANALAQIGLVQVVPKKEGEVPQEGESEVTGYIVKPGLGFKAVIEGSAEKTEENKDKLTDASVSGSLYMDGVDAYYNGAYDGKLALAMILAGTELPLDPIASTGEAKVKFPAEINNPKMAISTQKIVDMITSSVKNIDESVTGLIDVNAQLGPFTIYVLESDKELNVKFTVTKESLVKLAALPGVKEIVDLTPLLNALQLNACEITYNFNKEKNEFVGTEVKIDIAVKSAEPIVLNIGGAQLGTVTLSNTDIAIKLNAGLKATNTKVVLPDDLNTYVDLGAGEGETQPEKPKVPVFEEADAEKLNAVKAYLSANKGKLVGDREAADWMRGFEITLGADVNLNVDVKLEGDILISLGKLINGMMGQSLDAELISVGNISLRVDADATAKETTEWTAEKQETLLKDIVKAVGDVNAKANAFAQIGLVQVAPKKEGEVPKEGESEITGYIVRPGLEVKAVIEGSAEKTEENKDKLTDASVSGSLYMDGINAYYNGTYDGKLALAMILAGAEYPMGDPMVSTGEAKVKFPAEINNPQIAISTQQIVDMITGSVKNIDESVTGLIDINAQVGPFTIYVLESDKELNVKFTVTKESLVKLAALPGVKEIVDLTPLLDALQLNECEITYNFNKEKNEFVGTEVKIDIAVKSAEPIVLNIGGAQPGTVTLSNTDIAIKLNAGLKATDTKVVLPEDLDTYVDMGAAKDETQAVA